MVRRRARQPWRRAEGVVGCRSRIGAVEADCGLPCLLRSLAVENVLDEPCPFLRRRHRCLGMKGEAHSGLTPHVVVAAKATGGLRVPKMGIDVICEYDVAWEVGVISVRETRNALDYAVSWEVEVAEELER